MKKVLLKGLLEQAEQLTRSQKKNIVGGYTTPPPTWVTIYCQNSGGYSIGSIQSTTCDQTTDIAICKAHGYTATVRTYFDGPGSCPPQ
jgi:hypothetical protein